MKKIDNTWIAKKGIFPEDIKITVELNGGFTHRTGTREVWYCIKINDYILENSKLSNHCGESFYYFECTTELFDELKKCYSSLDEFKKSLKEFLISKNYKTYNKYINII